MALRPRLRNVPIRARSTRVRDDLVDEDFARRNLEEHIGLESAQGIRKQVFHDVDAVAQAPTLQPSTRVRITPALHEVEERYRLEQLIDHRRGGQADAGAASLSQ